MDYAILHFWYSHGEPRVLNENIHDNEMSDGDHMNGIDVLVGDQIRGEPRNVIEDQEAHNFDKLEEDAKHELYPGCTDYGILNFVIEMLNVKVITNLSNKGLDMMLELLTKVLPKGNLVPRSTYEAKKILRDLDMSYEHIDACKNDCALFWKENENLINVWCVRCLGTKIHVPKVRRFLIRYCVTSR